MVDRAWVDEHFGLDEPAPSIDAELAAAWAGYQLRPTHVVYDEQFAADLQRKFAEYTPTDADLTFSSPIRAAHTQRLLQSAAVKALISLSEPRQADRPTSRHGADAVLKKLRLTMTIFNRERVAIIVGAGLISGCVAFTVGKLTLPPEVHVHPTATVIRSAAAPAASGATMAVKVPCDVSLTVNGEPRDCLTAIPVPSPAAGISRAEQRAIDNTWPGLAQIEINHLQMALADLPAQWVMIFCDNDAYCGDLQMDFDNALETAHWKTELVKPMMDTTTGLSTSSPELKAAIEKATSGRLKVTMIPKQAEFFALVIGKQPKQ